MSGMTSILSRSLALACLLAATAACEPETAWSQPSVADDTGASVAGEHAEPEAEEALVGGDEQSVEISPIVIEGRAEKQIGVAGSASEGAVGQEELGSRPALRTAEVLEVIPGFVATQHSGSGKANQYFVRGFNLDHGSDFSARVNGVPVNLPTHAHGQGYLDLNFVIPELVRVVRFRKGPYFAEAGDFSSAGAADIEMFEELARGIFETGVGEDGFARLLLADSYEIAGGDLLLGGEVQAYDGPWKRDENLARYNALMRYTYRDGNRGARLDAAAYRASWDATDQVPLRAVRDGRLSRLGLVDPTDGGNTERYTLSGSMWRDGARSRTHAQVYGVYYALDLFSNFTYFLEDQDLGDQFHQRDRRGIFGGELRHDRFGDLWSLTHETSVGLTLRHDHIPTVALARTTRRDHVGGIREDDVDETALGLWAHTTISLTPWLRALLGLRGDGYRFGVDAGLRDNAGEEIDGMISPKAGLVLGPWKGVELYGNAGMGFHSNDARGTTIRVDPVVAGCLDEDGDPVSDYAPGDCFDADGNRVRQVDPLVRSRGAELGVRSETLPGLFTSLSLWWLELDSELVFVGDAGNTEAGLPSRRLGLEWANFYRPIESLSLDLDVSYTDAEFTSVGSRASEIPGAIPLVIAAGIHGDIWRGLFAGLRLRYLGEYPLIEDDSQRSGPTTLVNLRAGYRSADRSWSLAVDVLNLFDSRDRDIAYFYASRLPGEPDEGVQDIHFHPVEPRTVRVWLRFPF